MEIEDARQGWTEEESSSWLNELPILLLAVLMLPITLPVLLVQKIGFKKMVLAVCLLALFEVICSVMFGITPVRLTVSEIALTVKHLLER